MVCLTLSEKQQNPIRGRPNFAAKTSLYDEVVSRARGDFSSLQFFRIPALAVDLFHSAAKLV
jgi:hypothetical protein